MAKREVIIDVGKIGKREAEKYSIVVNLVGWKGFFIRLRIAILLVKLASWIAGMNYEEDQHVISLKKAKIE